MSERELGRGEKGRARPTFIGREWCRGEREKTAGHGAIDSHQWEVAIMERKWGGRERGKRLPVWRLQTKGRRSGLGWPTGAAVQLGRGPAVRPEVEEERPVGGPRVSVREGGREEVGARLGLGGPNWPV
jgi:hypothetical protein